MLDLREDSKVALSHNCRSQIGPDTKRLFRIFLFLEVTIRKYQIFIKAIQDQFAKVNLPLFMKLNGQRHKCFGHLKGAGAKNTTKKPISEESYMFMGPLHSQPKHNVLLGVCCIEGE